MKIAVVGLWHLGCVTAACLADAHERVIGYDENIETVAALQKNKALLFEPGLDALIEKTATQKKLTFTTDPKELTQAEVIWICFDTPVDDDDKADVEFVTSQIKKLYPHLANNALIVISSQIPVGTTRQLINYCNKEFPSKNIHFAVIPENLRLGKAIQIFTQPDRFVVGLDQKNSPSIDNHPDKQKMTELLAPFTQNIVWMSIESAEMTKHAINAFLATSVIFANELGTLCEKVGANASDVERGLKTEERIGPKAYVKAGGAIGGGTLMRDINYLIEIGQRHETKTELFSSIHDSNHAHKQWSCNKIKEILQNLKGKTISSLGLTYKVGTDTLRRSVAVETCKWLSEQGAKVIAYDPALTILPEDIARFIDLKSSLEETLHASDAVIISNELNELKNLSEPILNHFKRPYIFDPSGYLHKKLIGIKQNGYFTVGTPA